MPLARVPREGFILCAETEEGHGLLREKKTGSQVFTAVCGAWMPLDATHLPLKAPVKSHQPQCGVIFF